MSDVNEPVYTPRYLDALVYAADLHKTQMRKSDPGTPGSIPYLSHLLEVSALVWFAGGDETQAIAGLLHDALEDQYPIATAEILAERFGPEVRDIVLACTDGVPGAPRGSDGYLRRKAGYIADLYHAEPRALLVTAADKVSNAQAILADHAQVGDRIWARFNNPKEVIAWYYASVTAALTTRIPTTSLVQRLTDLSAQITTLVGSDDLGLAYPEQTAIWISKQLDPLTDAIESHSKQKGDRDQSAAPSRSPRF